MVMAGGVGDGHGGDLGPVLGGAERATGLRQRGRPPVGRHAEPGEHLVRGALA